MPRRMLNGKASELRRRLAGDRRQRLQEGVEIGNVGRLHARVGRIGKCRIEMLAGRRHALQHGIGEVLDRPRADAVLGILRNVGRHEGAERRLEFKTADQLKPGIALRARLCMTGGAAAGIENALALAASPGPSLARVSAVEPDRRRQEPPGNRADAAQNEERRRRVFSARASPAISSFSSGRSGGRCRNRRRWCRTAPSRHRHRQERRRPPP